MIQPVPLVLERVQRQLDRTSVIDAASTTPPSSAIAASFRRSSAASPPDTVKRCRNSSRCRAAAAQTAAAFASSTIPAYADASSRSASGVLADTVSRKGPSTRPAASAATPSTTRCAFVPLNPNDDTPARLYLRRPPPTLARDPHLHPLPFHPRVRPPEMQRLRHPARPQRQHHLDQPATPAAASRWPMLLFTDPIRSSVRPARRLPYDRVRAPATSIGSPSGVPVPCAST